MKKMIAALLFLFSFALLSGCGRESKPAVSSDSLYVKKIDGLSDHFILGADVSSLLSLEASGVKYYGFDGNETDLLKILSENGVNYIRVRVWNDPFDQNGNGYGGGNCTVDTAIELGKRAAKYGMKLLVDFHYSDFWADPSKQMAPKAWKHLDLDGKKQAVYDYTRESLEKIRQSGLSVGMVQIGNEITGGIAGETGVLKMTSILSSAADAVREFSPDTLIAVHFTNPESVNYSSWAYHLAANGVDYDVFASSYYPYWHGTLENLQNKLDEIAVQYGKKVMVAETQWAYTAEDSDFSGNSIGEEVTYDKPYAFSSQGQANEISAVVQTVSNTTNGIGVFYWEPAWIRVPKDTYEESLSLWEAFGSGWASSYAKEYDPEDAGVYYGGSACDNQALFDRDGRPLESLKTFALLRTGNEIERKVDTVEDAWIEVKRHNPIELPKTVNALMNDNSVKEIDAVWDDGVDLSAISDSPVGTYDISGEADGVPVVCHVKMIDENYIENYGFEQDDRSMWKITNTAPGEQTDFQEKATDAYSGNWSLHFWNAEEVGFTVEQELSALRSGTYTFSVQAQGGDFQEDASELYIYVRTGDQLYTEPFSLSGWRVFSNPTIRDIEVTDGNVTVGVLIRANGGAWGTLDEFLFNPVEEE